jgi:adenosylcobinamide kinase/adenosylcobinamide-phosphate guanylyltransferase
MAAAQPEIALAIVLIGGGARSGKSAHALALARQRGERLALVATAQAGDEEMRRRIERHRTDRGPEFETIEETHDLAGACRRAAGRFDVIVIDCLTLWLSNLMLAGARDIESEGKSLFAELRNAGALFVLVTNEVGCGIVPENELARHFRDHAGRLNQCAAEAAGEVYWMIFGCAMRVK